LKKLYVKNLAKPNKPGGNACLPARQALPSDPAYGGADRQSHDLQAAKEYSFLLLKFRLRSEKELASRLRQKKFSEAIIQVTLNFLKDKQFIDDQIFAQGWVAFRLKRPFGLRRIRQELVQKGLDKEIIEVTLAQAKEDYDEGAIVRQLAEQRFCRLKGVEPLKAKARLYAYLMRRGFSLDTVRNAVGEV